MTDQARDAEIKGFGVRILPSGRLRQGCALLRTTLSRDACANRRTAATTRPSHTAEYAMIGPTSLRHPRCAHRRAALRPHDARQTPTAPRRPTPGRPFGSRKLRIPGVVSNITVLRRTTRPITLPQPVPASHFLHGKTVPALTFVQTRLATALRPSPTKILYSTRIDNL